MTNTIPDKRPKYLTKLHQTVYYICRKKVQLLIYLVVYPFLWLISILPFRLLYLFSDFTYFLLYYVVGYRKRVVRENINKALPHLSDKERLNIEKKSYKHLCDMFLEMIKTMSISKKEIERRFVFTNIETYKKLEKQDKSIALLCAHYASYEWVISMNRYSAFESYAIYKKINNKYFDRLVKKIRGKFKAKLIHVKETIDVITTNEQNGIRGLYGFASDQSPQLKKLTHWDYFMGIDVPVYTGAEYLSKKFDMNVIYLKVEKIKRGFYEATLEVLSENVREIPNYQLTRMFLDRVEQQISKAPEFYLWTHRRWKHEGKKGTI